LKGKRSQHAKKIFAEKTRPSLKKGEEQGAEWIRGKTPKMANLGSSRTPREKGTRLPRTSPEKNTQRLEKEGRMRVHK